MSIHDHFHQHAFIHLLIARSYFYTTVAFLPLLAAAKRPDHTASVINISSMSGITRTSQHHFMYNVSKAATIHLNTLLAQELSKPAVHARVNSIAPGIFPSQMTSEYLELERVFGSQLTSL